MRQGKPTAMAISILSVATSNPHLLPPLCKPHKPVAFFAKNAAFPLPSLVSSSSLSSRDSGEEAASSATAGLGSIPVCRRRLFEVGIGLFASFLVDLDAKATRIEYYATVGEPLCDMSFAKSGLGYCDVAVGTGVQPPRGELINIHYTARFADGTVFDSSYKRGRPLTLRIGVGKVLPGLDQGILGGGGVPPMLVGGKRKLLIPPKLGYGPEPVGCFSGDCNIPGNSTLFYDILFVGIYK
ncbi:photosynthetic NDH subunit of lumenal location 4, chloroplastic [Phoenix dactylifera]|uniref:peptidylprolyl isomerase n=1 Tax=Phoenix dactylifera TaxID=42345 RepID=A0A8B8J4U1_PHODC|nr:photosynthetic NDH subunit of lumenal location 4, chloroplastic [Phoenix dactylifera]XP_026660740.1 photosynthetic NDH subunit of lumenal location 4, chloroplastic [Phoenix dactylifera]